MCVYIYIYIITYIYIYDIITVNNKNCTKEKRTEVGVDTWAQVVGVGAVCSVSCCVDRDDSISDNTKYTNTSNATNDNDNDKDNHG